MDFLPTQGHFQTENDIWDDEAKTEILKQKMSNVSSYTNLFTEPHTGTCWSYSIGPTGPVKELLPMLTCLLNVALSLCGVFFSNNITEGGKFLFLTQLGYGVASFCFHLTLWEGFYRILHLCLYFTQAIGIAYMACIPTEDGIVYNLCRVIKMIFSVYPFFLYVAVTLSESWVHWVAFDAICWSVSLAGLFVIWFKRGDLGRLHHPDRDAVFNLVWNTTVCVALAYCFRIIDEVACVSHDRANVVNVIFGHSLWHVFIGLGFYYMTMLTVFLMAENQHLYPKVIVWPKGRSFAVFIAVSYTQLDSLQRY